MQGYREMFVRSGYWSGNPLPVHGRFYVRLAPPEYPGALLTFASNDGTGDSYVPLSHVDDIRAVSNGWTFFGWGLSGMVSAGLASALDSVLAPWDLIINGLPGFIHLHATHGPPPLWNEWARVEQRLAEVRAPLDDANQYPDPMEVTDEVEVEYRRALTLVTEGVAGLGRGAWDRKEPTPDSTLTGIRRVERDVQLHRRLDEEPLSDLEADELQVLSELTRALAVAAGGDPEVLAAMLEDSYADLFDSDLDTLRMLRQALLAASISGAYRGDSEASAFTRVMTFALEEDIDRLEE